VKITQDDKLVLAEAKMGEAMQCIRRSRRATVADSAALVRQAKDKAAQAVSILDEVGG